MSRKYPRNESEKRWFFSRWRNVDNSEDVTLAGKMTTLYTCKQGTLNNVSNYQANGLLTLTLVCDNDNPLPNSLMHC